MLRAGTSCKSSKGGALVGTITIQWCSNCKVWAKCRRVCKEVMRTHGFEGDQGTAQTSRCDHYECQACSAVFQTRHVRRSSDAEIWTLELPAVLVPDGGPVPLQPA